MLKYNIKNLMKVRGITHPYAFLKKRGFSHSTAARLAGEKMTAISPVLIESLCLVLNCTPSDLFVWTPEKDEVSDKNHPLWNLRMKDVGSINDLGKDIPVERVKEFLIEAQALEEKYKNRE